jgi:NitT/TauT family transport system permease protein
LKKARPVPTPEQTTPGTPPPPLAPSKAVGPTGLAAVWAKARMPLVQVALLVIYLAIWEALVDAGAISPFILPAPSEIIVRFWLDIVSIVTGGYMAHHLLATLQEVMVGFIGGFAIAVTLGVAIAEWRFFKVMVYPYIIAFNAAPRVAFAPLFLIWFGFGIWSKVAMVIAIAAFPIMVGTIAGMAATDPAMEKLMRALGASRWHTFRKVRVPLALPYLFAGVESGVILAVIGAVVGEFAGGSAGLGYIVTVAQQQLSLPQGFSAVIILSLIGLLLHRLVLWLQGRVIYWRAQPAGR